MTVLEAIEQKRIIVVYRGLNTEECLRASEALMEAGVHLFEVTTNSPDTYGAIRALQSEFGGMAHIGAGTVTRREHVDRAAEAGATYLVSPNTNPSLIQRTKQLGMTSIPGALTPTEVLAATDAGADAVKIFPIKSVGADHLQQLRGPIDDVRFVATGGVTRAMIPELFAAGATAIAMGLHLIKEGAVAQEDWPALRDAAKDIVRAVEEAD